MALEVIAALPPLSYMSAADGRTLCKLFAEGIADSLHRPKRRLDSRVG